MTVQKLSLLFKDNFFFGFLLQEERLSGRQGTPSTSSVTLTAEQCPSHPNPPPEGGTSELWFIIPVSKAAQILFLVLWSLNVWSLSVLATGVEM